MKKLIVTADDYGVYPNINAGVIKAVKNNKVNSVAVFSNHKSSKDNVKLLLDVPEVTDDIEIGCHLTITSGRPLTDGVDFACDQNTGYFLSFTEFNNFSTKEQLDAMQKELEAQVEELNGIKSTDGSKTLKVKHLTNHHNSLTLFEHHFNIYMNVARKFGVPMRSANIQPSGDQSRYNWFLRMKLMDNLRYHDRREIKKFAERILSHFDENRNGILAPTVLNSDHYGPIPMRHVWPMNAEHWKNKKHETLLDIFEEFADSADQSMELMLHLADDDLDNINRYEDIDYPGVDPNYLDSRIVELQSILSFDFDNLRNVKRHGWRDLID